jgi:ferredoxin
MSIFTVQIDQSLCSGFGSCVSEAPDVFRLDPGGLATLLVAETDDPRVRDAADACPMGAITVLEQAAA